MIIAEMSANHDCDIEIAKETIRAAKRAGADAIKMQTYTSDTMTLNCQNDDFLKSKGGHCGMEDIYMNFIKRHLCLGNGIKNYLIWPNLRG